MFYLKLCVSISNGVWKHLWLKCLVQPSSVVLGIPSDVLIPWKDEMVGHPQLWIDVVSAGLMKYILSKIGQKKSLTADFSPQQLSLDGAVTVAPVPTQCIAVPRRADLRQPLRFGHCFANTARQADCQVGEPSS